jgi:hypothetical protein
MLIYLSRKPGDFFLAYPEGKLEQRDIATALHRIQRMAITRAESNEPEMKRALYKRLDDEMMGLLQKLHDPHMIWSHVLTAVWPKFIEHSPERIMGFYYPILGALLGGQDDGRLGEIHLDLLDTANDLVSSARPSLRLVVSK